MSSLLAQANTGSGVDNLDTDQSKGAGGLDHTGVMKIRKGGAGVDLGLVTDANPFPVSLQGTNAVSVSNFPATQPVSVASLPVPTGAALESTQVVGNALLTQLEADTTLVNAALGLPADASASSDTGSFSLLSLFKRMLTKMPVLGSFLSTEAIGVNQASPAAVTGTLTVANDVVTVPVGPSISGVVFRFDGTFVGTLDVQGVYYGGASAATIKPLTYSLHAVGTPPVLMPATVNITSGGTPEGVAWLVPAEGYSSLRIRAVSVTSGSLSVTAQAVSQAAKDVKVLNIDNPATVHRAGSGGKIDLNDSLLNGYTSTQDGAYMDVSGFAYAIVDMSTVANPVGVVSVESVLSTSAGSVQSDGVTYLGNSAGKAMPVYSTRLGMQSSGILTYSGGAGAIDKVIVSLDSRWLRFRISTAITGGTVGVTQIALVRRGANVYTDIALREIFNELKNQSGGPRPFSTSQSVLSASRSVVPPTAYADPGVNQELVGGSLSATAWVDATGVAAARVVLLAGSTLATGAVVFEQSSDNTSSVGQPLAVVEQGVGVVTGNISITANQNRVFYVPLTSKWWRVRTAVAFTGASTLTSSVDYDVRVGSAGVEAALGQLTALTPALGSASAAASRPVANSRLDIVTGTASLAALNTDLLTNTVSGWLDVSQYRSWSLQLIGSAGITAGTVIIEQTNDSVLAPTGAVLPVAEPAVTATANITAAFAIAANTQRMFTGALTCRYVRVRTTVAFAGGNIRAVAGFSQQVYTPPTSAVVGTTSSLPVTATLVNSSQVIGSVTGTSLSALVNATFIASAAITTTQTSASVLGAQSSVSTAGQLQSIVLGLAVTVVSGTSPTLDVVIQESFDNGTTWEDVYHYQRVTTVLTKALMSPSLLLRGTHYRVVRTVGGTTPSFTNAMFQVSRSIDGPRVRQFFDRTIAPATLGSATPAFLTEGANNLSAIVASTSATTPATYQLQVSSDGSVWANVGTATASTATGAVSFSVVGVVSKYARVVVTAAGTAQVLNYVSITAGGV